jgi:DNA-binding NarL/FixJ family response regulator
VLEDFEPFRQFICSTLRNRPELQIVAEVSDRFEAIRKAKELQTDLIFMEVGLPIVNGISAARQSRILALESKIIFVHATVANSDFTN